MKRFAIISFGVVCLIGLTSLANEPANPYVDTLKRTPAAELPARAAELVQAAKGHKREGITVQVVKAAVEINPAASPSVVGAIARAVPDMAAIAAGVAAAEQPKQASAIARAAAAAAPSKAGKIVTAVCKAVPNEYRNIATEVAQAVPTASKEILEGVASAIPGLKPYIQTSSTYNLPPAFAGQTVGSTLDQASALSQAKLVSATLPNTPPTTPNFTPVGSPNPTPTPTPSSRPRPPAVGPPYIPLSGTPTNVNPSTGGEVPPNGRDYSRP